MRAIQSGTESIGGEYHDHAVRCALESFRAKTPEDRELYREMTFLWRKLEKLQAAGTVRRAV
jgi:hypothetical protein